MTSPAPGSRAARTFGSLALAAGLLVLAPSARAADEGKELVREADKAAAGPATKPATKPAKADAPAKLPDHLAPAVKTELEAIRDAYRKVESLKLAGTIKGEFDVDGEKRTNTGSFEASFRAPTKFRHVMRDGDQPGAKDDLHVGGTGEKVYAFVPARKQYATADAPKERAPSDKLGRQYARMLEQQNPSLLLALSDDAAAEIARDTKSIEKLDDVTVGDTAYSALKLTGAKGGTMTMLFDPKTHLLRRVVSDIKSAIDPKGEAGVKKAEITVDYATAEVGAEVKAEQFAWAPPQGARDMSAGVAAADGDDEAGGAGPAAALEGKPAPDFTLPDADGKDVSLKDLKGSVVVLDFWATWCGPCRVSLPHLDKIYNDTKGDGVKAYAVNLREEKELVAQFVEKTSLQMPVLFDKTGKVASQFNVRGIPQTVVIGKDGTVKKVVVGSGTHDQVRTAVEEAMK